MTDHLEPMDPFELALRRRMLAASDRVLRPFDPLAITDAAAGPSNRLLRQGPPGRDAPLAAGRRGRDRRRRHAVRPGDRRETGAADPPDPGAVSARRRELRTITGSRRAGPSSSQSPAPTPSITSGPAEGPVPPSWVQLRTAPPTSRGASGCCSPSCPPRTSDSITFSIADRNDMTVEWWRPGAVPGIPGHPARLTFLDHAGMRRTSVSLPMSGRRLARHTNGKTTAWAKASVRQPRGSAPIARRGWSIGRRLRHQGRAV